MSKPGAARFWSSPPLLTMILSDQVKSLDWRIRKAEFICKLSGETTDEVLDKLGTLLIDES
jgi:mRNA-degrading endonuclease toxin of MazEF toxin-antitoxin module